MSPVSNNSFSLCTVCPNNQEPIFHNVPPTTQKIYQSQVSHFWNTLQTFENFIIIISHFSFSRRTCAILKALIVNQTQCVIGIKSFRPLKKSFNHGSWRMETAKTFQHGLTTSLTTWREAQGPTTTLYSPSETLCFKKH